MCGFCPQADRSWDVENANAQRKRSLKAAKVEADHMRDESIRLAQSNAISEQLSDPVFDIS
jgi:hypothetical protein